MSWFYNKSGGNTLLNGLVEWWPLSEASGSRAGAHAGLTLTDNNSVTGADGVAGSLASSFAAANDEFLSRASQSELNPSGSFTFAATFWFEGGGAVSTNATILGKYKAVDETSYWLLAEGATGRLSFYVATGDGGAGQVNVQAVNFGSLSGGTWYWGFAWYDADAGQIGITVNTATPDTAVFAGPVNAGSSDFRIGDWEHPPSPRPMNGRIQRVGLWSRVLTSDERIAYIGAGSGIDYPFA